MQQLNISCHWLDLQNETKQIIIIIKLIIREKYINSFDKKQHKSKQLIYK
jgi:hypothetical protein